MNEYSPFLLDWMNVPIFLASNSFPTCIYKTTHNLNIIKDISIIGNLANHCFIVMMKVIRIEMYDFYSSSRLTFNQGWDNGGLSKREILIF